MYRVSIGTAWLEHGPEGFWGFTMDWRFRFPSQWMEVSF